MNPPAQSSARSQSWAPTATYKVSFRRKNGRAADGGKVSSEGGIPRVTRLLALAHRIEGMIRAGELKDWAKAARLIGVTRARMTQIANLLLLAPEIQKDILNLPPIPQGQDPMTEHRLRSILAQPNWHCQRSAWSYCTVKSIITVN